jgi:hypothetical protein
MTIDAPSRSAGPQDLSAELEIFILRSVKLLTEKLENRPLRN